MLKAFSSLLSAALRKNWICSPEVFCAEPCFCSGRTHLMPLRKPIKTMMEQTELLLTWSAGSGWRRSAVTCPVCSVVAHFYFYLIIHIAFNSASLHPPPPPTYIHSVISDNADHYGSPSSWPIRVWLQQAWPQLLRLDNNTRALRADWFFWFEFKNRGGEALQENRVETMT